MTPRKAVTPSLPKAQDRYVLRLYIIGTTPRSMRAVANLRKVCEEHLKGRYDLEVIDVAQHPDLAAGEQIIAAPTLIEKLPLPLRRFIGDLSQTERILLGLDLLGATPEALTYQGGTTEPSPMSHADRNEND